MTVQGTEQGGLPPSARLSFTQSDLPLPFLSNNPHGQGNKTDSISEPSVDRSTAIEHWRTAIPEPERKSLYSAGTFFLPDGTPLYDYPAGKMLVVENKQVMDTCETPWAQATVNQAFKDLGEKRNHRVKVLERGFGLGITTRHIALQLINEEINRLTTPGTTDNLPPQAAEHHIIELNHEIAKRARNWVKVLERFIRSTEKRLSINLNINFFVHEGDAYEETKKLVDEGKKFDVILSDTVPLRRGEEGINDIQDSDILEQGLEEGGVLAFFAYYPGCPRGFSENQQRLLRRFKNLNYNEVPVRPHPGYTYLIHQDGHPILELPVVTCKKPRKESGIIFSK